MKDERSLRLETELIYEEDAYCKEFSAKILECIPAETGYRIVLDRTAFFPEGGGQKSDSGFLGNAVVTKVLDEGGRVFHYTEVPFKMGATVVGRINWDARFQRMQNHTGEHLISGLIYSEYGFNNVGFHLGDDVVCVDIDGTLNAEDFERIVMLANQAVTKNLPVKAEVFSTLECQNKAYRSKLEFEGDVRLVTIPGYDCCACCAPHVSCTGEIGFIEILSYESHRGGMRFTMLCGEQAVSDTLKRLSNNARISALLSAKPLETADAVERLLKQTEEQKMLITELKRTIVNREIEGFYARAEKMNFDRNQSVSFIEENYDEVQMRTLLNAVVMKCSGYVYGFFRSETDGYRYIIGSAGRDCRVAAKEINQKLDGRGGGSPKMVQGSVNVNREEIEAFMESMTKHKYTTVVFDMDGTLLDTLKDLQDSVNYVCSRHDVPLCSLEQIRAYVGNGVKKLMERAVGGAKSEEEFEQMYSEFVSYYAEHNQIKTAPYDGIIEMIQALKEQGYKMAIVSNKIQEGVTKLKDIFFANGISVAIGESQQVKKKPAPDSVYLALEQLGSTKEEAVYIGDSEVDYETAQNSGLRFLAVTWGFRDREVIEALGAKDFVTSPLLVPEILEEFNRGSLGENE